MRQKRRVARSWSLRRRIFSVLGMLVLLPLIAVGSTYHAVSQGKLAEQAKSIAARGALHLAEINAKVYAVVMESRGIYMSQTWAQAEPFAKNLEKHLVGLETIARAWQANSIESERGAISELSASIAQFAKFRRELVRLAKEDSLASARAFGDNEVNRSARSHLNKKIEELAANHLRHEDTAEQLGRNIDQTNLITVVVLGTAALVIGVIGVWFIQRTVIGLFNRMSVVMAEIAAGNLDVIFEGVDRNDQIGDYARAIQAFKDGAHERRRLERQAEEARAEAEAERRTREIQSQKEADELAKVVSALGNGLDALSKGNLTYKIDVLFDEKFEKLRLDFNAAVAQLRETLGGVVEAVQAMSSGTTEISAASQDLSRRTEQNAASLEQTAAALQQITGAVGKTAEVTKRALEVVSEATAGADRGRGIVGDAVDAMHKIEGSSQKISQIISVIDEIAFQTNLLALNAGVEAARAGEAGRGFAVVASEVRALAQRSADAAKEIKGLILSSTSEVEEGAKLVRGTGEALVKIVANVTEINRVINDIAASASEQASGLSEVNSAVNEMDKVTQQNAAMAEEATAASQSLANESKKLTDLVDQFSLGETASGLRAQLKAAVPHAFRESAIAPSHRQARKSPRDKSSASPDDAAPAGPRLYVANQQSGADWKEF